MDLTLVRLSIRKHLLPVTIYQMMLDANVANVKFLMSINADVAEFVPSPESKITRKAVREFKSSEGG